MPLGEPVDPLASFKESYGLLDSLAADHARRAAGGALAAGNYDAARGALYSRGLMQDASAVTAQQNAGQDRQAALAATQRKTAQDQQAEDNATATNVYMALQKVPEAQRTAYVQNVVLPFVKSHQTLGTPDLFQHLESGQLDLSDAGLTAGLTMLGHHAKIISVAPGGTGINEDTGQPAYSVPEDPKYQAVPAGGMLVQTNPGRAASGVAPPVAQATPSAPGAAPSDTGAAATAPMGSRADRNHNPLNIKGTVQWDGMTGVDSGGFAQFATDEAGMVAADKNLKAKQTLHGLNTVQGIIGDPKWGWSPQSDPGNAAGSTANYIASVAKDVGVQPDQPLDLNDPAIRHALLTSMARYEGGGHSGYAPAAAVPVSAPASSSAAAPTVIRGPEKAKGHPSTDAELQAVGLDPKTPAWTGEDGKPTPYDTKFAAGTAASSLTGDDFLKTLPIGRAATIRGISEGRVAMPNTRTPDGQRLMDEVMQYDPTASAVNLPTRQRTQGEFSTGKAAQTITSLNTMIHHMATLNDAIDGLHNSDFTPANQAAHAYQQTVGITPELKRYRSIVQPLAGEAVKVSRGGEGTEKDVTGMINNLSEDDPPKSQREGLKALGELARGRIVELGNQYIHGMGLEGADAATVGYARLSPQGRADARKLGLDIPDESAMAPYMDGASPHSAAGAQSQADGAPARPTSKADLDKLPKGAAYINPADGRVYHKNY